MVRGESQVPLPGNFQTWAQHIWAQRTLSSIHHSLTFSTLYSTSGETSLRRGRLSQCYAGVRVDCVEACTFPVRVSVSTLPLQGTATGLHSSPQCW